MTKQWRLLQNIMLLLGPYWVSLWTQATEPASVSWNWLPEFRAPRLWEELLRKRGICGLSHWLSFEILATNSEHMLKADCKQGLTLSEIKYMHLIKGWENQRAFPLHVKRVGRIVLNTFLQYHSPELLLLPSYQWMEFALLEVKNHANSTGCTSQFDKWPSIISITLYNLEHFPAPRKPD